MRITLFYHKQQLMIGWYEVSETNPSAKKIISMHCSTLTNRQVVKESIHVNRVMFDVEIESNGVNNEDLLKWISGQIDTTTTDDTVLYDLCRTGKEVSVESISDPFQRLGTIIALETKVPLCYHFARQGKNYVPEPVDRVKEKIWLNSVKHILQTMNEKCGDLTEQTQITDLSTLFPIDDLRRLYVELASMMLKEKESPFYQLLIPHVVNDLQKTANAKIISDEIRDAYYLQRLRILQKYTDDQFIWKLPYVYLERANVHETFPEKVLNEANAVQVNHTKSGNDQKRGIATITIDSKWTRDFDDAITILDFQKDEFVRVVVHITDVSQLFRVTGQIQLDESDIFREALQRVTSSYIPGLETNSVEANYKVFPMLPDIISTDKLSLFAGRYYKMVSYEFILFTNGTHQFVDFYLEDNVYIDQNLCYEECDQFIADGLGFWSTLSQCCNAIHDVRVKNGAAVFDNAQDLYVLRKGDLSDDSSIEIVKSKRRNFASGTIITELSILSNTEIANACQKNNIPTLYSGHSIEHVNSKKKQKTENMKADRTTGTSFVTPIPKGNMLTGSPYYTQQTSPLRRIIDLCSQLSVVHYLLSNRDSSKPLFNFKQLEEWAASIEQRRSDCSALEKRIMGYWVVVHLNNLLAKHKSENSVFQIRATIKSFDKATNAIKLSLTELNNFNVIVAPSKGTKLEKIKDLQTSRDVLDVTILSIHVDSLRIEVAL